VVAGVRAFDGSATAAEDYRRTSARSGWRGRRLLRHETRRRVQRKGQKDLRFQPASAGMAQRVGFCRAEIPPRVNIVARHFKAFTLSTTIPMQNSSRRKR